MVRFAQPLLPFRYIERTLFSSYSMRRMVAVKSVTDGPSKSGLQATTNMRENPDGFPSSRVRFAQALLPFRYIDGTLFSSYSTRRMVAVKSVRDGRSKSALQATTVARSGCLRCAAARTEPAPGQRRRLHPQP